MPDTFSWYLLWCCLQVNGFAQYIPNSFSGLDFKGIGSETIHTQTIKVLKIIRSMSSKCLDEFSTVVRYFNRSFVHCQQKHQLAIHGGKVKVMD